MADFTPITTQEELNAVIGDRLKREKESTAKKYEGYISPADVEKLKAEYEKRITEMTTASEASAKKYADYDKQIAERDSKIKNYETASLKSRIAHEAGLPYGMASRLSGETEEDIKADAEGLKALIGAAKTPAPLRNPAEPVKGTGALDGAFASLAKNLKGD